MCKPISGQDTMNLKAETRLGRYITVIIQDYIFKLIDLIVIDLLAYLTNALNHCYENEITVFFIHYFICELIYWV